MLHAVCRCWWKLVVKPLVKLVVKSEWLNNRIDRMFDFSRRFGVVLNHFGIIPSMYYRDCTCTDPLTTYSNALSFKIKTFKLENCKVTPLLRITFGHF